MSKMLCGLEPKLVRLVKIEKLLGIRRNFPYGEFVDANMEIDNYRDKILIKMFAFGLV